MTASANHHAATPGPQSGSGGDRATTTRPVVVKIGGRIAADRSMLEPVLLGIGERASVYAPTILVHGGGDEVTSFSRRLGLEPRFQDGIRITTAEEMPLVEMVLGGSANTALVRRLQSTGVPSVGLTGCDGASILAQPVQDREGSPTCTGRVTRVAPALFTQLLSAGYVPVLASIAMDFRGSALNVNADEIAFEVAKAVAAEALVFIADTKGILKDGEPIAAITADEVENEIASGVIKGGMIVKARSAVDALASGVARIVIGSCNTVSEFAGLVTGEIGTRIAHE